MIRDFIGRMETTAKELMMGVLIFGAAIWLVCIWFVPDKGSFTRGLLIGVAGSLLLALHMSYSIEQSLERPEKNARGYMQRMSFLRMGMVLILFGITYLLQAGSVIAIFAGLFTLKFGAYFQPVLHRLLRKVRHKKGTLADTPEKEE